MGRTGRRDGTIANTTFFIEAETYLLQAIALVELARTQWVERVRLSKQSWHILLHQIMAMCLERGGVDREMLWKQLHSAHCFADIPQEKFFQFIDFLTGSGFLHPEGNQYSMGIKAEEEFGRKNFMEIYAVFSAPVEFEVVRASGDIIGSIEWKFLESLLETESTFFLSGKAWAIDRIEWKKKVVVVQMAPHGKIPKWGGLSPRFLGYEICRQMRDILVSDAPLTYLSGEASSILEQLRGDRKELLLSHFAPIEHDDKGLRWWTYAGGHVNNTLRFALTHEMKAEVQATNEFILIKGNGVSSEAFRQSLIKLCESGYWESEGLLDALIAKMPDYRLSKFQPFLPKPLQLRLVADVILEVSGTKAFLGEITDALPL